MTTAANQTANSARICMIVQNYYDIDPRVRREAEALVESGYDVDVIALRENPSDANQYTLKGVNVRALFLPKKRAGILRYLWEYFAFLTAAFWYLNVFDRRNHYDLVQVHTLPDFLVFATIVQKIKGILVLLDMHEIAPEFFQSKFGALETSWSVRLITLAEKLSTQFADFIITVNDPIKELLISRGVPTEKIGVVVNSANPELFSNDELKQEETEGDPGPILMYHGTLTDIYGLDLAICALPLVRRQLPHARLSIVGDGPAKCKLEALARNQGVEDHVDFAGRVPQDEIESWIRKCDIGVLPTRQDEFLDLSLSNKLAEYIVIGKPVVASALNTTRHYFSDTAITYFTPGDPQDLVRKIVTLANDSSRQLRQVIQAQAEYSTIEWSVMRSRYITIISNMLSDKSAV